MTLKRITPRHVRPLTVLLLVVTSAALAASGRPDGAITLTRSTINSGPASSVLFGSDGRYQVRNATLLKMAAIAYEVQPFQISGGPDWVRADRYDIDGTVPAISASPDGMRRLLRAFLAERFHLTLTRSTRLTEVFRLETTRQDSPRLRPSLACAPTDQPKGQCGVTGYGGHLSGTGVTMAQFADALSTHATRLVLDRTARQGRFTFALDYMPEFGALPARDEPASRRPPGTGPTLRRALDEQLGLTLVPVVEPVNALWIEAVARPDLP